MKPIEVAVGIDRPIEGTYTPRPRPAGGTEVSFEFRYRESPLMDRLRERLEGAVSEDRLRDLLVDSRQGVLATINRDGSPQLSNILYIWDADAELARISTLATRVKSRNLERDGRCTLYVSGAHFWQYVAASGQAELGPVAAEPGDEACMELLAHHSIIVPPPADEERFFAEMIEQQRRIVRFRPERLHGLWLEQALS